MSVAHRLLSRPEPSSQLHAPFRPRRRTETNGGVKGFNRSRGEQSIHGKTYRNGAEIAAAVAALITRCNRDWRLGKLRSRIPLEACPWLRPPVLFRRLINPVLYRKTDADSGRA